MKRGGTAVAKAGASLKRSMKPIAARSTTKARRREQAAGPSMASLRPLLWARCGRMCERCCVYLDYETFDAHHRKFRSRGGLDRIENLVALCQTCHGWAHRYSLDAMTVGLAVLRTEDPATIAITKRFGAPLYLTTEGTYSKEPPA